MTGPSAIQALLRQYPGRFSSELGIGLGIRTPGETFKWFLASVLFGARISESIVKRTFRVFAERDILTPRAVLATGGDGLVAMLDRGGYARYDFKTASKLLDLCRTLHEDYRGDLHRLHAAARDPEDLEQRLKALARGIGNVTVNIFLRELRGIWTKADPLPSDLAVSAARDRGIVPRSLRDRRAVLAHLRDAWKAAGRGAKDFPDLEAALVRAGIELRRKRSRKVRHARP